MGSSWRLELFYKTEAELAGTVVPFLRTKADSIKSVNLTNKAKGDRLVEAAATLRRELPHLNLCVHYSCKWNSERSVEASFRRLEAFAGELSNTAPGASVLLVSGGGKKRAFDSLKALQLASQKAALFRQLSLPFFVAFNPYLPDPGDAEEERVRLQAKVLESRGLVKGVYLQMGTDIARLEAGIQFLQQLQTELAGSSGSGKARQEPLQLLGSVFLPSKRLLAQMRFRPWNGVFLSEDYLGGVEAAEAITRQLLEVYRRYDVVPLVESAVKTGVELARVRELLQLKEEGVAAQGPG